MKRLTKLGITAAIVFAVWGASYIALERRVDLLPHNSTEVCKSPSDKETIVFFGDSLTHGTLGYNFVDDLAQRPAFSQIRLINAGLNASLAYNLRARLPQVLPCAAKKVFVLIGTNDANGSLDDDKAQFYIKRMKLPQTPTLEWFESNLTNVVQSLSAGARVYVSSVPPIGEVLSSRANVRVRLYNSSIRRIASESGAVYVPFYETLVTRLLADSQPPKDICESRYYFELGVLMRYVFRMEWNSISDTLGLNTLVDCVHLNERGGRVLADVAQEALLSQEPQPANVK